MSKLCRKLIIAAFGALVLLLSVEAAQAVNCSDAPYFGVIDGNFVSAPDQIQIDTNCTIRNFPSPNILGTNFSFYTQPGGNDERWLVVFDNVVHTGNMSCNATHEHKIWFTNGSSTKIQEGCQNLLIPVEKIDKRNPTGQSTATIGIPFTYRLTIPVLYDPAFGVVINNSGSLNDLHGITVWDDLNATGADLAYVSHVAYWQGDGTAVPHTFSNASGLLTFEFPSNFVIPSQQQIIIEITAVLNDTPANVAGTQFVNTAKWEFGRLIDGTFYEPLPGEWGQSAPMTIAAPNLVVTKTSEETALNLGVPATFDIDVQNTGGSAAWNATILDQLPDNADAGMCDYDPRTFNPPAEPGVSARIVAGDGTLIRALTQGADYSLNYTGSTGTPACQLSLTMTDNAGPIAPEQHLFITYQTQLDADSTADGRTLTNVAGATQWFSADSSFTGRRAFSRTLSDGTPAIVDHEDSYTITTALSGYYFQKTVENLSSHVSPAEMAAPGDRLRYRLRLFNVDQTINGITISDPLDLNRFVPGTFAITSLPAGAAYTFNQSTGLLEIRGDGAPLNVAVGDEIVIEFDITLQPILVNGTEVLNQASFVADDALSALSDDPYVNGIAAPGEPADPTRVLIQTPGPLSKVNTQTNSTIGEQFRYRITVPANPIPAPLYDVRILDDLSQSAADLRFVNASVVSGGAWTLTNTSGSNTQLAIEDTITGIDIPANGQAVIEITVELLNTSANNSGLTFNNTATYAYNRANGDDATQNPGGEGFTANMTVVEPAVTAASKTASFVSPAGKSATDPATVGDVLEYVVTIPNSGSSTAFDSNVVDTLPATLSLVADSATARINGVEVAGFVANPTTLLDGALAWGRENGDPTLAIPPGQSLVLTYQVTVISVTGADIVNSVYTDWTSLSGASTAERTGAGCPAADTLNDYCYGPVTAAVSTVDNTSIGKSVVEDSYAETPASTTDPILRVGDTVTYELTVNLQEYTTRSVAVEDALPAGMALESFTINAGTNFSYTLAAQPAAGAIGTLRWEFGDITNLPSNDGTPVDALVIRYVARVVTDAPPVGVAYDASIPRDNLARLFYAGGDPAVAPDRLTATARIEVRQPQMRPISKVDLGSGRLGSGTLADPYQVNIAADVMNFRLSSCNDGLAPAYGVVFADLLAPELDEGDLTTNPPVVRIGAATLVQGTDYNYSAPGRGGEMRIALLDSARINPGECATVDYNIGFHTDLTVQKTWGNQARLPEYRSLPLSEPGRLYTSVNPAQVWMTNLLSLESLSKTLQLPVSGEATIGEEVVYQIRAPAVPMNATLDNVVVTDNLHGALEYLSATAVDGSGNVIALVDNTVAPGQVNLTIASIPAGQQAIISLRTRVANNDQANAGTSFANTASYTYTDMPAGLVTAFTSGPLTIVEPLVTVTRTASTPAPAAGAVLTYTLNFTAAGAGAGDNFSDVFDLSFEESLGLGQLYEPGSAMVNGQPLADPLTNGADGVSAAQILTWSPASGVDIDIAEGATVSVTYQVRVLASVAPGQTLSSSVIGRWTGLDGDQSAIERTGSGTPAVNDYFTEPAIQTLTTPLQISFVKSVDNATTGENPGANANPGDTLRYTLVLTNESIVPVNNASLVDELAAQFVPGSLQVLSVTDTNADRSNSNATGGANGTGIVDIRNLTLAAQGDPGDTVTIELEATLVPVIQSGTIVLNQAQLTADNLPSAVSNETSTLINSAPSFQIWKTSQDMTGDTNVLMAGDTLRYTLTVKNIGSENATGVSLRDWIPDHTIYVANTTRLNGVPVADPTAGVSALQNGLLINAPEDTTPGAMRADASATTANVATITFDVVINSDVLDGAIVANQGFVIGAGAGSGPFADRPSDDPATTVLDDPTRDIVGNLPLVDAQKTVSLLVDANSNGAVDLGDVLRYTITVSNSSAIPAAGVMLTDAVPANSTYSANSVMLNGAAVGQPDGGISPLIAGVPINSAGSASGIIAAGASAEIIFAVEINAGVAAGTVISNQGYVDSSGLPTEPTDADGIDSNGDQPTTIVVGSAQQLLITKEVVVVGGGVAQAGGQLEFVVRVTNTGTTPATQVVLTDDLSSLAGQASFVAGSATLNGLTAGVTYADPVLTANYAAIYGDLQPAASAVLRFRVLIDGALPIGTTLTNTAQVTWNTPPLNAESSVSLDLGGIPGSAMLNGHVWHDANFDNLHDTGEQNLAGWTVALYRNNVQLGSMTTDAGGLYRISGLAPSVSTADQYELRFSAPGTTMTTAKLGLADSAFTNGMQQISGIDAVSGSNLQNLNLPIDPNGVVFNSIVRAPIAGATLTMLRAGSTTELPGSCFDDPAQQNQVTQASGFYKFDLNYSDASCPQGGDYVIRVTQPTSGYLPGSSRIIPPVSHEETAAYSVATCSADAVPAPVGYCEANSSAYAPAASVPAAQINHYLHLTLSNPIPGDSQLFNNHIAIDPTLDNAVSIRKTTSLVNVSRGQLVPYTITVNNTMAAALQDLQIVDTFPPGFKYVEGSARVNGQPLEPVMTNRQLSWSNLQLESGSKQEIQLLFIVGSGVGEGEYVNRAQMFNTVLDVAASGVAAATVRVVPDPTFDCTDIIGKVFDDRNLNGQQEPGEDGLAGVRVVTARGLIATTDEHGRFHITCAVVPDEDRGSNFILKLDDRSLPTGYRVTTENPRVQRATRGKMLRFNFGATIHRVVAIDIADGVFEPDTAELRLQWAPKFDQLLAELKKSPSVLRLSYLADVEGEGLVKERLKALKKEIAREWGKVDGGYRLDIETEVFWRRGGPPER